MARDSESVGRPFSFPFDTTEDFTLNVPANQLLEIFAIAVNWNASGNAGNRVIQVTINAVGVTLFRRSSKRVQVANELIRYVWAPGMPDEEDVSDPNMLLQPMPLLHVEEGGLVEIIDSAGIDNADGLEGRISARIYTTGVDA